MIKTIPIRSRQTAKKLIMKLSELNEGTNVMAIPNKIIKAAKIINRILVSLIIQSTPS